MIRIYTVDNKMNEWASKLISVLNNNNSNSNNSPPVLDFNKYMSEVSLQYISHVHT